MDSKVVVAGSPPSEIPGTEEIYILICTCASEKCCGSRERMGNNSKERKSNGDDGEREAFVASQIPGIAFN